MVACESDREHYFVFDFVSCKATECVVLYNASCGFEQRCKEKQVRCALLSFSPAFVLIDKHRKVGNDRPSLIVKNLSRNECCSAYGLLYKE